MKRKTKRNVLTIAEPPRLVEVAKSYLPRTNEDVDAESARMDILGQIHIRAVNDKSAIDKVKRMMRIRKPKRGVSTLQTTDPRIQWDEQAPDGMEYEDFSFRTTGVVRMESVYRKPKTGLYLTVVVGDVEPEMRGPYPTPDARDEAAKQHRINDPNANDGIYMLDIDGDGKPTIGAYSGGFFEEELEGQAELEGSD